MAERGSGGTRVADSQERPSERGVSKYGGVSQRMVRDIHLLGPGRWLGVRRPAEPQLTDAHCDLVLGNVWK